MCKFQNSRINKISLEERTNEYALKRSNQRKMIQQYDIKTADDIKNAFKELFGEAVQEIMEAELDTHLGYEKHSKENKDTMGLVLRPCGLQSMEKPHALSLVIEMVNLSQ